MEHRYTTVDNRIICVETYDYGWMVSEVRLTKSGKTAGSEYKDVIGYYGKVRTLISGLFDHLAHEDFEALTAGLHLKELEDVLTRVKEDLPQ